MFSSVLDLFMLLVRNKWLYIIAIISMLLTALVPDDAYSTVGLKMIPSSIGVLLGGLLAAIAIIFSIIKDEDLDMLNKKYGDGFFDSLNLLKHHILFILLALLFTLTSFFIGMPAILAECFALIYITPLKVFYFIQIFFMIMTIYSTIEVINILFLIFEIKFTLIKNKSK